jgi:transcriptional regulator with XRE-family HTH domain
MTIVEITGSMLRAARSLTGLSQQELADRASISRPYLTAWEGSSGSVPNGLGRAAKPIKRFATNSKN